MPSILLIPLVGFFSVSRGLPWNGPKQTNSATETASWSPVPTDYRWKGESFLELIGRDIFPVSVCGWIGGQASLPAYCSTESSCVWNSDNSIVGCCAIQSSECKFYTSCVDINSPNQVGNRDDVFTCKGLSVCYTNHYPGNYIQWGCGSSDWATTVATSFDGIGDQSLQIVITGLDTPPSSPSTSSPQEPSTIPMDSSSSVESTQTSEGSSESATSTIDTQTSTSSAEQNSTQIPILTTTETQIPSSPAQTSPAAPVSKSTSSPTGPIIGGVLGGVALLAALISLVIIRWRKGSFSGKQQYEPANPREGSAFLDGNPIFEMPGGIERQKGKEVGDYTERTGQEERDGRWKVGVGYSDISPEVSPALYNGKMNGGKRLSELP